MARQADYFDIVSKICGGISEAKTNALVFVHDGSSSYSALSDTT